jgi:hypothetical protein
MSSAYGRCSCCGKQGALDLHHRFHQTAWAKRLYGQLLHDHRNLQLACNDCHASHRSPLLEHWDEERFCAELGLEPRSRQAQMRRMRGDDA